MDRDFGLIHVRLQTWFPLQLQVDVNGHEWLARKLAQHGVRYSKQDNAFVWIEDFPRAQRFADRFVSLSWVERLDWYAHQVNPLLADMLTSMTYYWVTTQAEYATDLVFKSRQHLAEFFPRLLEHSTLCFSARDVLSFLGRKWHGKFEGEVVTDQFDHGFNGRLPGRRVKHRMKRNWIKMYEKAGAIVRVEKPDRARAVPKSPPAPPKGDPRRADGPFPIVGIGASVGGLEALEQFLRRVPEGSGLAFVIVQHLDPTHRGILPELLQRATGMPVRQVKDRTRVQHDCVYVIPPNKDLSILRGVLHLMTPTAPRGLRLPIDSFFRALAADQRERSVGVILSGMGTDGTLGLRAIKEKAGLVLVQAPESAKFDSMPRSAIDAGLADLVGPVEALPGKLLAYLRHALLVPQPQLPLEAKTQSALEKVVILLRAHTGHDFSQYKESTV